MKKLLLIILSTCVILGACANTSKEQDANKKVTLTVSAAASLKDALTEIEKKYESEHNNIDVKLNYGASGALAQQIKSGAPVDIFFSAAQDKVDDLVKDKKIAKTETKPLIYNHLLVVSTLDTHKLTDLKYDSIKKIAIGNPELVPAGQYGKQALENAKVYESIKHKLVLTKDVRQVLTYVETKNVEAGIVYQSDLASSDKVKYSFKIDDALHDTIQYPIAKIKDTKNSKATNDLYEYLQTDASKKIYKKYGFDINKK
ncbi:molybdate ABC transporter substrate-binding protein [Macrococcus animalis]|uniref:molybdate ABC transporter substrate-binding protein n=1 Tax=Macrococcus animalis TaxID=3395467 RepID=UPI0039BE71BB